METSPHHPGTDSTLKRNVAYALVFGGAAITLVLIGRYWNTHALSIVVTISSLLVVSGVVLRLVAGLQDRLDTLTLRMLTQLGWNAACERLGLTNVSTDSTAFDYAYYFTESRRLTIILNDGRTWLSIHRDRLRKRFADPNTATVVILIHPDSPMLEVLARKGSTEADGVRARIREAIILLDEIRQPTTDLEVLGHFLFNPHSLVLGDSRAAVIPYFYSRGSRQVPVFEFADSGEHSHFRSLLEDVERLRMDAGHIPQARLDMVRGSA